MPPAIGRRTRHEAMADHSWMPSPRPSTKPPSVRPRAGNTSPGKYGDHGDKKRSAPAPKDNDDDDRAELVKIMPQRIIDPAAEQLPPGPEGVTRMNYLLPFDI